jgi:diacylglycerol kinase family enzyme
LESACALLAGTNGTAWIDAMRVGASHYFTQLGVGVDALMIRETSTESKKRFGQLAYISTALRQLMGFPAQRFSIAVDDQRSRPRASQVLLANSGTLGTTDLRWGPGIRVDDGRIDVCIVRAQSILDHAGVAWSLLLRRPRRDHRMDYLVALRTVAVHCDRTLPVQADGEIIGETPIEVAVVPRALAVVVPPRGEDDAG